MNKEELINSVYNLILSPTLTSEECDILVRFKNKVEQSKDFDREVMRLAEEIRQLAVRNLHTQKTSPEMAAFYKEIATNNLVEG